MSIMNGWQFQCATTTCLPFSTVTVSNMSIFSDTLDPSTDLQASTGMITMIVKDGTRVPSGLFKYNDKD
ncbi:hypothetical protein I4U23_000009 [Adineta vaga]|nr:hypothetical protein I4U23_000009 [Adineta vaga]